MITPRNAIAPTWSRLLSGGPLGIGLDIATTEKQQSNPSSLAVMEKVGSLFVVRLVVRWKTSKEEITRAMVQVVFDDLKAVSLRPRRFCVDATNERFFAQKVQRQFQKYCPVQLVVASENVPNVLIDGEPVDYKSYCGNLYINTAGSALLRLPEAKFLKDDHRLVKKEKGRFVADTAPDGSHADTFDGCKLARLALEGRGRAEISGTSVGGSASTTAAAVEAGLKNPLLRLARRLAGRRSCA